MGLSRKLLWDNAAKDQLRALYQYIRKDSPQNALAVRTDIIDALKIALDNPEHHPPDRYRIDNPGLLYRAFELHRYRISYLIEQTQFIVTRIRHTSMEPLGY